MAGYDVHDFGTTLLAAGAVHWWDITWGFSPYTFIWVTAQPMYKNTSIEMVGQYNWMDANGVVHHNYGVKNIGSNWAECREICVKGWP